MDGLRFGRKAVIVNITTRSKPGTVTIAGHPSMDLDPKTETVSLIHEAIEFHIEGMLLHGEDVPQPTTLAELVKVGY